MRNYFSKEKSDFLKKKDKSKKGCIDEDIKEIIGIINSNEDYYTTSSCAGRIVLLEMKSRRKNDCEWIFTKHGKVTFSEIFDSLVNQKFRYQIWFKQQPLILHVACRNIDAAKKLLEKSRKIFKRTGIISLTNRKTVLEIIGDDRLETVVANKDFVVNKDYIKKLVNCANANFEENLRKCKGFLEILKSA